MSLSTATTDAAVIEGLTARVTSCAAAGQYGANRRRSFSNWESGRRNQAWLEWGFGRCCKWYRSDKDRVNVVRVYHALDWDGSDYDRESQAMFADAASGSARDFIVSSLAGWLLSIVAGWLLDLIVDAFVSWLLSPESAAWRAAVEGEA